MMRDKDFEVLTFAPSQALLHKPTPGPRKKAGKAKGFARNGARKTGAGSKRSKPARKVRPVRGKGIATAGTRAVQPSVKAATGAEMGSEDGSDSFTGTDDGEYSDDETDSDEYTDADETADAANAV